VLRRRLFIAIGVLVALVGAFLAVEFVTELTTRGCSLSGTERSELLGRVSQKATADALDSVFGASTSTRPLELKLPDGKRDFALDQGPQRVCISGAVSRATPSGSANVLVRIYDSPTAATKNASSNLASAPMKTDTINGLTVLVSDAMCTRSDGSTCLERSAQSIVRSVSVVVKSRELSDAEVVRAARDLALRLSSDVD
jgi:hypothetical protein